MIPQPPPGQGPIDPRGAFSPPPTAGGSVPPSPIPTGGGAFPGAPGAGGPALPSGVSPRGGRFGAMPPGGVPPFGPYPPGMTPAPMMPPYPPPRRRSFVGSVLRGLVVALLVFSVFANVA